MNTSGSFSLNGKTVLLTGSTGHLGTAIALGLGEAGADLLLTARQEQQGEKLVSELSREGINARFHACDLTDKASLERLVACVADDPIHGLVNNAYSGGAGSVETALPDAWRAAYEVAVVSAHSLVQALLPNLRRAAAASGEASVVNIGSMYGNVSPDIAIYADKPSSNPPFYGAAKAALGQFTRYAACEFATENIRVNSVSPGPFPSHVVQADAPDLVSKITGKCPMKRIGQPHELAGPVVFLISSASSYITGADLAVDGGWTAW
ncbi:SDR family NAD(P)-dependent oxidoreductase [Roseibium album]|uniref:SDR family NAD(P)-dependent oxidoreductase n=1 Tax=Roseibium album TaxID=311410 RepID=UPI002492A6E4|nr:SDR family oxidoreductase [Roseibium album]